MNSVQRQATIFHKIQQPSILYGSRKLVKNFCVHLSKQQRKPFLKSKFSSSSQIKDGTTAAMRDFICISPPARGKHGKAPRPRGRLHYFADATLFFEKKTITKFKPVLILIRICFYEDFVRMIKNFVRMHSV